MRGYLLSLATAAISFFFSGFFTRGEIAHPQARLVAVIGCAIFGLIFTAQAIGIIRRDLRDELLTKEET